MTPGWHLSIPHAVYLPSPSIRVDTQVPGHEGPLLFAVSAPGEHTAAQHADSEDAAPPSTPCLTDFHTCCARMGPPENKVDRSGRIRFPVLKVRPNAGVHKYHQAFRLLRQVHPSGPLDTPHLHRKVATSSPARLRLLRSRSLASQYRCPRATTGSRKATRVGSERRHATSKKCGIRARHCNQFNRRVQVESGKPPRPIGNEGPN